MTAGERLRREREAAGLSRKEVAEPMGRVPEWVRLYEIGKRPVPPAIRVAILEMIQRLSAYRTVERKQRDAFVSNRRLPRYVLSKRRKKAGE
jgi:transcriptional regulator with XRE-family HTH domain